MSAEMARGVPLSAPEDRVTRNILREPAPSLPAQ